MVYFTDYFDVDPAVLEEYGAFNISLINDLPLFIDPFLLYGSEKFEYKALHYTILKYLSFLRDKSIKGCVSEIEIASWYKFSEVKQNWLGFSVLGNNGSGLGETFGHAMSSNMRSFFHVICTKKQFLCTDHMEKAALFEIDVGEDNISDFTCNLIESFCLSTPKLSLSNHWTNQKLELVRLKEPFFPTNP